MVPFSQDPGAPSPLHLQLLRRLRWLIQQGERAPGLRNPAGADPMLHLGSLSKALAAGIGFAPGPLFFCDGRGANCLRLNFSTQAPDRIREAIPRLGRRVPAASPSPRP